MRIPKLVVVAGIVLAAAVPAQALSVNGASAELDMRVTLTRSDGLVMTFVPGHGWNGSYAYVYTDVGGAVSEDEMEHGAWPNQPSTASASTLNGAANGSVAVTTAGFDYSLHADAMVEGLAIGDHGLAMGNAYAWPDYLRTDAPGTATLTINYAYTLDARDTCDNAEASVFMNAFFADHARDNYLTAQDDWTVGPPNGNGTTNVQHTVSIDAGEYLMVSDSVSWDVVIPSTGEPYSWWSIWAYGEAQVEVDPIPEPITMAGMLMAVGGLAGYIRRRRMA